MYILMCMFKLYVSPKIFIVHLNAGLIMSCSLINDTKSVYHTLHFSLKESVFSTVELWQILTMVIIQINL